MEIAIALWLQNQQKKAATPAVKQEPARPEQSGGTKKDLGITPPAP